MARIFKLSLKAYRGWKVYKTMSRTFGWVYHGEKVTYKEQIAPSITLLKKNIDYTMKLRRKAKSKR